jgi:hypothetical protein
MQLFLLRDSQDRFIGRKHAFCACRSASNHHFPVRLAPVLEHPHRVSKVVDDVLTRRAMTVNGDNAGQLPSSIPHQP